MWVTGPEPCESQWTLSQGFLRRFTSLILILVYSGMAASRVAGTPPPPAPPLHPSGHLLSHYTHIPRLKPSSCICLHCLGPRPIPHLWELGAAHTSPSPPAMTHLHTLQLGLLLERQNKIYSHFAHGGSLAVGSTS